MAEMTWIERTLSRERSIVVLALLAVIVVSWIYLLAGAGTGMSTLAMSSWTLALGLEAPVLMPMEWTGGYAAMMFLMWWIMMIAMMLPSAAPMILVFARLERKKHEHAGAQVRLLPTAVFTGGYLVAWAAFSVVAVLLQWAFESMSVLSPMMMNSTNSIFGGLILLFAGAYQLTPLKQACLSHCQHPIQFLIRHWRAGTSGAARMGFLHGAYCLGCCWGLMALLFFGGVMNLYWIVGLALLILTEKLLPVGIRLSYLTGALFSVWGLSILVRALV